MIYSQMMQFLMQYLTDKSRVIRLFLVSLNMFRQGQLYFER